MLNASPLSSGFVWTGFLWEPGWNWPVYCDESGAGEDGKASHDPHLRGSVLWLHQESAVEFKTPRLGVFQRINRLWAARQQATITIKPVTITGIELVLSFSFA